MPAQLAKRRSGNRLRVDVEGVEEESLRRLWKPRIAKGLEQVVDERGAAQGFDATTLLLPGVREEHVRFLVSKTVEQSLRA